MEAASTAELSRLSASADVLLEARPATAWWLRMWLLKWVQRTRWPTGRTAVDPTGRAAGRIGSRSEPEVARATQAATGLRWVVPWAPGLGGHRTWRDGAWRAPTLLEHIQMAWRAWVRLGGLAAIRAEAGKRRDFELTRRAANIAEGLRARLQAVPKALEVMANARRRMGRCATFTKRDLYNLEVAGGFRADGRQRWAIDQVLQWKGSTPATRQALVRWLGFNPVTREEWDDSWVPRAWMTSDLRQAGRIRKRKTEKTGGTMAGADQSSAQNGSEVQAQSKQVRVVWQRGLGAIPTRARGDG